MAANALEMLWIGLELGLSKGHSMLTRREFALGDPERQARAANVVGEGDSNRKQVRMPRVFNPLGLIPARQLRPSSFAKGGDELDSGQSCVML